MSASITISNLGWSTPDGRLVFSGVDLSFGPDRVGLVGRNGVGKTRLLRIVAGDLLPTSGRVTVNGTLGILRQTVQLDPGATIADLFGAGAALALLRRAEAGTADMDELAEADWTLEARIEAALASVGLDAGPDSRLGALSGGQGTRASLAGAIFAEPDFLLLDEPTNNLDRAGRQAVLDLLANWRAGAIIVSHDRELLEAMDAIVEMTKLGATLYGGNWSAYRERKAVELAAAQHDLEAAEKRIADVARKVQATAERKDRKDAAGQRSRAKGGMPRILLGARKQRAEGTSGDNARLAERQRGDAQEAAGAAREKIERLEGMAVTLPPTGLPANRTVLELRDATVGYVAEQPVIRDLSFTMTGPARVAVSGANGSGKTTLLALITGGLTPWAGSVRVMVDVAMLDQRVSILDPAVSIRDNFVRLNPGTNENACRAALARFQFRADAALRIVATLSGGQMLRAGLACVLGSETPPQLLILDEPTNHLDLDSIEAVEAGLRAYDGALLVVSHDEAFLDAIRISERIDLDA